MNNMMRSVTTSLMYFARGVTTSLMYFARGVTTSLMYFAHAGLDGGSPEGAESSNDGFQPIGKSDMYKAL